MNGKILIVEDELLISKGISAILEEKGYNTLMVPSGEEALAQILTYSPDLILMDIGLEGKLDGMSTAGIIKQQYNVPVIFITDHKDYLVYRQAQTAAPSDYIGKPVLAATLLKAVNNAFNNIASLDLSRTPLRPLGERVENGIFVFEDGIYHKVLFADILYLKASKNYTDIICTDKKTFKVTLSSNHVVSQMACPAIVRVNKSFYINIHRVDSMTAKTLLIGDKEFTMTDLYKQDILSRMKKIVTSNNVK